MMTQVPSPLAPHIVDFCKSITLTESPVLVVSEPPPEAAELDCFITVEGRVEEYGGTRVIGWAIWEVPGAFLEAEFHAVWQTPSGEYLDLTPRLFHLRGFYFCQTLLGSTRDDKWTTYEKRSSKINS